MWLVQRSPLPLLLTLAIRQLPMVDPYPFTTDLDSAALTAGKRTSIKTEQSIGRQRLLAFIRRLLPVKWLGRGSARVSRPCWRSRVAIYRANS